MKMNYKVKIIEPQTHYVQVTLNLSIKSDTVFVYLPSWSPGSYLMREYARHVRKFEVKDKLGKDVFYTKVTKGRWSVDLSEFGNTVNELNITYEVYCHELTVRTSYIDSEHAFLHGPSYLMSVEGHENKVCEIELNFPGSWSKVTTGLKDISTSREKFQYSALNYDEFIDAPIEIGCHETDGFQFKGKDHHLAFFGKTLTHKNNLKEDIKQIVETVAEYMGEIPYDSYTFITHFAPNHFGGLEHLNSTALGFDGRKLADRSFYVRWLTLVTHEYFHTWNVKRIRPVELGPFDYQNENYTSMLWLAEGLTSFMDNYLTLKSGLITETEYWGLIKDDINRYFQIMGRKFDSLESSSFDAWIKLYRPDENSSNSSISYYLKGGLAFLCLDCMFRKENLDSKDFVRLLWKDYKDHPEKGITKEGFFSLLQEFSSKEIANKFDDYLCTTQELDFESLLSEQGVSFEWEAAKFQLGCQFEFKGERVFIKSIMLDSGAYKGGLNVGDQILSINALEFDEDFARNYEKYLLPNETYSFGILRKGSMRSVQCMLEQGPRILKKLTPHSKL